MVLNYIWIGFFLVSFLIAVVRLIFMGDVEVFPAMMDSTFESSKTAFEISIGLTGVLALSPMEITKARHRLYLHEHRRQYARPR